MGLSLCCLQRPAWSWKGRHRPALEPAAMLVSCSAPLWRAHERRYHCFPRRPATYHQPPSSLALTDSLESCHHSQPRQSACRSMRLP